MDIILCIPGSWADRSGIVTSIAAANTDQYIFAGNILLHLPTNEGFEVTIAPRDENLIQAFTNAGQGRLGAAELEAIGRHSFVVYLKTTGGDLQSAQKIMHAGLAFLQAGGLGVKVETSGKAFDKERWGILANAQDDQAVCEALVLLLRDEHDIVYSCGMHNLGLRDVICDINTTVNEAAELADIFNVYQVLEKPQITSGQTFSTDVAAPAYRITTEDCTLYPADDLFYNPYGMYRLQEVNP